MKRNILICFLFLFATALQSSSLKEYSIEKLEKILVKEFHPYPTYGDDIWFKIPDSIRLVYINQAEMRIHDNWESLPASLFMEYKQTGADIKMYTLKSVANSLRLPWENYWKEKDVLSFL